MAKDSNTQYIHSTSNHLPRKKYQVAKTQSSSCSENGFVLYLLLSKCNRKGIGIKQQQCSTHFKKGFNKKTILLHRDFHATEGALKCQCVSRSISQTMPTSHPVHREMCSHHSRVVHVTLDIKWRVINSNFFNHLICKYF